MQPLAHAELIRQAALALGFARVGFTPVGPVERHRVYQEWLERGYAGDMAYLARDAAVRRDPAALLATAKTLVTVALSYAHAAPVDVPADRLAGGPRGTIARYARGADYHHVLKEKLRSLARTLGESIGGAVAFLPCVDTAPLLEREAAQAGGIGFIAKNTMLIAPGAGSYVLLGELLVDVECEPGVSLEPRCGQCRACLDACPTGAFVDAYTLDARRCISYLTIELTGPIPRELRALVGDRVFGCDVCQEVCPFNASASDGARELAPRAGRGLVSSPPARACAGTSRSTQSPLEPRRTHVPCGLATRRSTPPSTVSVRRATPAFSANSSMLTDPKPCFRNRRCAAATIASRAPPRDRRDAGRDSARRQGLSFVAPRRLAGFRRHGGRSCRHPGR